MSALVKIKTSTGHRIFGLDLIRASAIVMVLLDHSKFFFAPLDPRINVLTIFSFLGVELFFVLSGFLIGGILIRQYMEDSSFRLPAALRFWKRRWFRTLPNYFLVLFLSMILYRNLIEGSNIPVYRYFFFIQNLCTEIPPFFRVSWSLSVEEWFYLLLPFCFFLLNRLDNKKKGLLCMILITLLFFTGLRFLLTIDIPVEKWNLGVRQVVIYRLDAVCYGVLLAYFHHFYQDNLYRFRNMLMLAGVLLFTLSAFWYYKMIYYSLDGIVANNVLFASVSISFALMFPKITCIQVDRMGLLNRIVTHLSLISYSMYLLNYGLILIPLSTFYVADGWRSAVFFFVLFWTLTIIASSFLYKYYEKPMMELRERSLLVNFGRK